ncbi:UNVERIFIED_CONTAM: hypothetical protein Scaly_1920100 [Sesamum calycinum]|uniref:DUF4283 domain-containing protein n=1 Tax=Sesamum calycinum TaxID=2727403 RepID=A0AAW2NGC7_9LAMI
MASKLNRLGASLSLTEEEEAGVVLPTGLWHADSVTLLKFFHILDRNWVLERCPWAFDKNLLVLAPVEAADDPNLVDLNWWEFHIHIHGLPLGKMTKDIATFIGNKLGRFKDVDLDKNGESEQAQANPSAKLIPPKPSLEQYRKRGFCWRGCKCGGLVVLWVKSVSAQLPSFSQSHIDLSIRGDPLTWSSRHTFPNTVLERLHRACASGSWSQLFPNATIENLPVSCLDHKVLHIRLEDRPTYTLQCSRPCRFEAAWLQSEQYEDIVAASWGSSRGLGGSLEVASKLASCQQNLHRWSRDVFRADKGRLNFLENQLKKLLAGSLTEWIQEEISRTRKELEGLAACGETVWRQRSKDTWLREGDWNTSFFHQRASNRFHTNQIHKIKNF